MATIGKFEDVDHVATYAEFRPVYPKAVASIITSFMDSNESSGYRCAVDVACGSGQSTFLLSEYFDEVFGYDISATQIAQAKLKCQKQDGDGASRVQFKVGDAHNLPISSSSVDLLTCAMAWHWLDAERFYEEAKRVLKPRGCLAVYGHNAEIKGNERIKNVFDTVYGELIQSSCLGERNMHVWNKYNAVELPFTTTKRIEFDLPQKATIRQLMGLMTSVSAYRSYCEKFPENDLLHKVESNYELEKGRCNVEEFCYQGFIILGIKD